MFVPALPELPDAVFAVAAAAPDAPEAPPAPEVAVGATDDPDRAAPEFPPVPVTVLDAAPEPPELALPDALDVAERLLSAGCAVQNMLLMATAQGYGSALTSGKALKAAALRALFQLLPCEQAVCFVSIGTVVSRKAMRTRPHPSSYVSTLDAERGVVPGL